MKNYPHPIVCFMGPSASGKTTLAEHLFSLDQKIITTTTRKKRKQEKKNRDYYFVSPATFLQLKKEHAFFETDFYANHYYGTLKKEVEEKIKTTAAFIIVTVPGFYALQNVIAPLIPVYLFVEKEVLSTRLKKRNLSLEDRTNRLLFMEHETKQLHTLKKRRPDLLLLDNSKVSSAIFDTLKKQLEKKGVPF